MKEEILNIGIGMRPRAPLDADVVTGCARVLVPVPAPVPAVEPERKDDDGMEEEDVDVDILVTEGDGAYVGLNAEDGWVEEEPCGVGEVDKVPTVMVDRIEVVADELDRVREEGNGWVDVAAGRGVWKEPDMWSMLIMLKGSGKLCQYGICVAIPKEGREGNI